MARAQVGTKPAFQIVASGSGHYYKRDGETRKGRGVTTLIKGGMPSGGLLKWAAKAVAAEAVDKGDLWQPIRESAGRDAAFDYLVKAPDRDRDAAGNKGTLVHKLAQDYTEGKEIEVPVELEGFVDAYIDWRETWQPQDERIELVGANLTYDYYGRLDAIASFTGWFPDRVDVPARVLYDLKTSRSGPFESDALQVNAYARFEQVGAPDQKGRVVEPEPMERVDALAILHLSADGWRFIPVEFSNRCFAQFLHCAKTAEFAKWAPKPEDRGWGDVVLGNPMLAPYEKF